jgi:D-lyxose ketol-isomerase
MRWRISAAARKQEKETDAMRRSEINRSIATAKAFFAEHGFLLPPFAYLGAEELRAKLSPQSGIYRGKLGWDVTDFGQGDFAKQGILLFTIRNGDKDKLATGRGRLYCEKLLFFEDGQSCPAHSHYVKTEDIINRGGGRFTINLMHGDLRGNPRKGPAQVLIDEEPVVFEERATVHLDPGQSIVLEPGIYHELRADDGSVMLGEVSLVNDDLKDNIFLSPVARFSQIVEDEPPLHLLCADYDRVLAVN